MDYTTTAAVCKFLIKDVICRYRCVGKIMADRGELDAEEAEELLNRLGVKLSLTTTSNPEANGKIERGHSPIVKAIVRACEGHCTRMRRPNRQLAEVSPICAMGRPDHPQFSHRVHVGGTNAWTETCHANRKNDRIMDDNRLV